MFENKYLANSNYIFIKVIQVHLYNKYNHSWQFTISSHFRTYQHQQTMNDTYRMFQSGILHEKKNNFLQTNHVAHIQMK